MVYDILGALNRLATMRIKAEFELDMIERNPQHADVVYREQKQGVGVNSIAASKLVWWAAEENDRRKAGRILNVAKRIEQRYRLAHGLPNMGV